VKEKDVFGFDLSKSSYYENGFYLTSDVKRMPKIVAHYELYKKIKDLPGDVLEFGVFKGSSLISFCTFREVLESPYSRRIVGFDVFGKFPPQDNEYDNSFISKFEGMAGDGIDKDSLDFFMKSKGFANYELIKGDILDTLPKYIEERPELKVSLLHIDVDVYEPSSVILETLFDKVVDGGIIILDDYGTVYGETKAADEFFKDKKLRIEKLPISHRPAFVVKK
jgi:hypothetical protein